MPASRRGLSISPHSRTGTPLPRSLDNTVHLTDGASPPDHGIFHANATVSANRRSGTVDGAVDDDDDDLNQKLLHRVKFKASILSLAVSEEFIYAGSQSGEILVWCTETYELVAKMKAHSGSVLALVLSEEEQFLFSSGGDAIVNVWDASGFKLLYSIYSTFDVGDVFCVAYSKSLQTAYFGAQNTSIQWYDLKAKERAPRPTLKNHPSRRSHRFFDSKGPGGKCNPLCANEAYDIEESRLLEIDPNNIVQYAHYSYVYCMQLMKGLGGSDEETLLSGGGDGDVKIWSINPETAAITVAHILQCGDQGVLSMVLWETFLYCGLTDGDINIWDLDTYQRIRSVKGHRDDILTMAVWGNSIFSGSADGNTRKWNERFQTLSHWEAHSGLVLASTATTRRGRVIFITGGNDNCVSIWDVGSTDEGVSVSAKSYNDQLLSALGKLVSFKTVSNNPLYLEECRRGATYLRTLFKRFGATSTLLTTDDNKNPIVFARFSGKKPTKKTILFYGHYDVIPADQGKDNHWETDPFELTGVNGYLYGRGVSDNKGPCLAALFAVGELVQEQALEPNVVFLIEGEEECGSRGFANTVRKNRQLIGDVDWMLLSNSYWLDDFVPCLTYGMRGVIHATVEIESHRPDLHSGVDGSRLNHEPTIQLVNLLAKLTSEDGTIMIPGFYDPVRPVTKAEEVHYTEIANHIRKQDPSVDISGLKDHLMSKWRFPSLTIHRIDVSGPSNAAIIPRTASACISIRVVPDQQLSEVKYNLESHLRAQFSRFNSTNKLRISIDHEAEPWLADPKSKAFTALETAIKSAWGSDVKPLYIREGGSIPTVAFLEKEFGCMAAHFPCGQASDHAHLDNERLRLENLYKSKAIFKEVFVELGQE